jgi:uncharacterized protein (TIGR02569 family)
MDGPPEEVLAAFGVHGQPNLLAGGEGVTFRVDGMVFKRIIDVGEAEWTQALLQRVEPHGFRIAEPVATNDGRWVHAAWSACKFVDGLRPAAPAWSVVTEAGLRFCDEVERVRDGGVDVLAARTHRWSIADRVAWGEGSVELPSDAADLLAELVALAGAPNAARHFVHGDLSGNVFLDPSDTPVILDVSPYLRPRQWSAAIVTADAVLWNDEPLEFALEFVTDADHRDLFARALIFRMVAEQLARDPRHGALLDPYRKLLPALK